MSQEFNTFKQTNQAKQSDATFDMTHELPLVK